MTLKQLPKLTQISLDDIGKRPIAVLCALLIGACIFLMTRYDKGNERDRRDLTECNERYNNLVNQLLIQNKIIEAQNEALDSAKTESEKILREKFQLDKILK